MSAYFRETAVRAGLAAWALLTCAFCLLCNVPMAWRMIIEWKVYPAWVAVFLDTHAVGYCLLLILSAAALARSQRTNKAGRARPAAVFLALCTPLALLLLWSGRANIFKPGALGWTVGLLAWLPAAAWELLLERDLGDFPGRRGPADPALESAVLGAAVAAALTGFAVFSLLGFYPGNAEPAPWTAGEVQALHWSLAVHLLAFLAPLSWWSALRAGAALTRVPEKNEAALIFLSLGLGLFAGGRSLVLIHLLPLDGAADLYAAAAASGMTLLWRGQCLSRARARGPAPGEALGFALAPLTDLIPRRAAGAGPAALLACAAAACGFFLARRASLYDWNRIFETLIVLSAQGALFAVYSASRLNPNARQTRSLSAPAFILLFLGALWSAAGISLALEPSWRAQGLTLGQNLRRWEEKESSFRSLRKALGMSGEPNPFYAYLRQNANLDPKTLAPLDLRPVERWGQSLARRPDIYLFVIDSLRRDYLGAYNPKVAFTPAIDAFAAESLLVRRAFAAYGGTVLSIASLWAGSHLPHGNVTELPAAANSLERLLEHEGYRRPAAPQSAMRPPESGDVHLCPALDKLLLEAASPRRENPLFAFTFAADAHMSVVEREGRGAPEIPEYRGFRVPYAHRISVLDACLGRFIKKLKEAGRYDQSLIILTSDHGELLGEGGLAGHAGSLRPEVISVPLIVHLPKNLGHWRPIDPASPVLLTDITPTLYALLGHKPVLRWESQGQNFLWDGRERPVTRARSRLLACSYTPVFGLLREEGRKLYYASAAEAMSYYYDLEADPGARNNLTTPAVEAAHNAMLRVQLEEIRRIFTPAR